MASNDQKLDLRIEALRAAVDAFSETCLMDPKLGESFEETYSKGTEVIVSTAQRFYGWLAGPSVVRILIGPVVPESSDQDVPKTPVAEGETVQINTGQKFSVAIDTADAAGYPTDATVEWTVADETVATVTHDDADDQKGWVVSGAPGSTVLTVKVTDVDPPLEATLAVDVVPAGTATIAIVTGEPVDETPATP